jgi:membrane fusion protein, epimerase transport system
LITVSADLLSDEQKKASFYLARIKVNKEGLEDLRKNDLVLVPGMPAEVLINTGDRTFIEYLMKPLSNIFARSFNED